MSAPRILIVQKFLPPYRLALFQRLAASPRLDVTLAYGEARRGTALESIAHPPGVQVLPLRNTYWGFGQRESVVYQHGLQRLLSERYYDCVIAEFNPRIVSTLRAFSLAKRRGMKFIWWGHGMGPHAGAWTARLRMRLTRNADALVFYNGEQADRFVAMGVPREKVFVAWNSIDTEAIAALYQAKPFAQRNRVLYVGRLIVDKKIDLLIRAFAQALPQLPANTQLTIIGDGPEQAQLEQLARECGLVVRICDRVVKLPLGIGKVLDFWWPN